MRKVAQRLKDILHAIDRIESRIDRDDEAAFRSDEMLQVWVVHHLQTIGEACRKLPDDLKAQHPEVPWKSITGMRHYLVHEYFRIELDTTWQVVEEDLQDVRRKVEGIIAELEDD
jgi:uncharacterized protein with HEPN domain